MRYKPLSEANLRKIMQYADMIKNRDIGLYESELGLDINFLAKNTVKRKGRFIWYDLCCGEFNAGTTLITRLLVNEDEETASKVIARGVDITAYRDEEKLTGGVVLLKGNAVSYPIDKKVDLITCHQGLRYIEQYLGEGHKAVVHWYNSLPNGGVLAFNTISRHIQVGSVDLVDWLKQELENEVQVTPRWGGEMYNVYINKLSDRKLGDKK